MRGVGGLGELSKGPGLSPSARRAPTPRGRPRGLDLRPRASARPAVRSPEEKFHCQGPGARPSAAGSASRASGGFKRSRYATGRRRRPSQKEKKGGWGVGDCRRERLQCRCL